MIAPALQASAKASSAGRIMAFDGLRGFAALIVVVFHYLAMLHPAWVPDYTDMPVRLADTPLGLLWNGPFAVSVFFVLSGFVMAAAAERRQRHLLENVLTRYLRLALPVLASVLLAWALLTAFPTAARDLAASLQAPSDWLDYTLQEPVPGVGAAVVDGLASNFITGGSAFNNVLWTMQIELVGSVLLFLVYWLGAWARALRFVALAAFAALGLLVLRDAYLCFVAGALIYEARKAGMLDRLPPWAAVAALGLGIVLGAPGQGFAARWGMDILPGRLQPGNAWGLVPVLAASLILLGVQLVAGASRVFERPALQWLGRISFALYLVHVPLLYTVVAWERVALGLPEPLVAAAYLAVTLGLAHLFTLGVDEPSLRLLRRLRKATDGLRPQRGAAPVVRGAPAPLWPWVVLGAAALLPVTLFNGGIGVYYDSVIYLHRPEGFLRLLSLLPFVDVSPAAAASALEVAASAVAEPVVAAPQPEGPRILFGGRSMFYQIFAWTGLEFGRLWPLAFAQALMVAYPAALLWARVLGLAPGWRFVLGLGALGLLTPLGLVTGIAMPDILAGVLVMAIAVLMAGWTALSWPERGLLFALTSFAMVSHTSHLLLGLTLPAALLLLPLRDAAMWRGAAVIGLAAVSAVGLEQVQKTLQTRGGDTVLLTRPHLVAHLVDDGPAVDYLQRACPGAGFEICDHVDKLPMEWRAFLFGGATPEERVFADAPPEMQIAISTEQFALTRAVLADDPLAVLDFAARAWLEQLVRFDPAGGMVAAAAIPRGDATLPPWFAPYPGWMQTRLRELTALNEGWMLTALHASTWGTTLLALGALGWTLRHRRDRPEPQPGLVILCAALLLGVVLNAAICGILASPYDRFQARIIWLIPLAGLALLATRGRTGRLLNPIGTVPSAPSLERPAS
ncbi:MAG: acyltransferase family protein [Paracoccaceae bacterium]